VKTTTDCRRANLPERGMPIRLGRLRPGIVVL